MNLAAAQLIPPSRPVIFTRCLLGALATAKFRENELERALSDLGSMDLPIAAEASAGAPRGQVRCAARLAPLLCRLDE